MALARSLGILSITTFGVVFFVVACRGDSDGPDGDEGPQAKAAPTATGTGTAGLSAFGGACKTLADCAAGAAECNSDLDGQCTKPCQTDSECGGNGAICEVGGGNCYHACTTNADCTRTGYACVGGEAGHKFCDPKHEAGGSCTSPSECASGLDICNDDPGGQCTKNCTTQSDCSAAAGSVCETERPGHCYHECTSKADCDRDGYDCLGGPNPEGKKWCDVIPEKDAGKD